jgi:uncharacterized protein (UPF0333 family)
MKLKIFKYKFINLKKIKTNKAQISLEYMLIFTALLVIFGTILLTATNIYNKNLNIMDNQELKNTSENIQKIINFQELQVSSIYNIKINPQNCWKFTKINNNSFYVENQKKIYEINSNYKINISNIEICSKKIIDIQLKEKQFDFKFN